MDPILTGSLLKIGADLIDRIFPDKQAREEAKLRLLELEQKGDLARLAADTELARGQLEINRQEAAHRSVWTAGWRPSIGWTCSAGLFYEFILRQLMNWGLTMADPTQPLLPALDIAPLMTLVAGLLGLGTLRTYEKVRGVAR